MSAGLGSAPDEAAFWGVAIRSACRPVLGAGDPAHDEGHLRRVLAMARWIAAEEGPHDPVVLTAAALLRDLDAPPRDSLRRVEASRASARAACGIDILLAFDSGTLVGFTTPATLFPVGGFEAFTYVPAGLRRPGGTQARVGAPPHGCLGLGRL